MRSMWSKVKARDCGSELQIPTAILECSKIEISLKKLAVLFKSLLITKVKSIMDSFSTGRFGAKNILKKLPTKPDSTFSIHQVTITEVDNTITDTKSTNACGFDALNSKVIKMIPHFMKMSSIKENYRPIANLSVLEKKI